MTHYPFNRRRHIKERDRLQVSLLAFFLLLGGLVCSYEIYSQNFVRGTQFSSYNRIGTYNLSANNSGNASLTLSLWRGDSLFSKEDTVVFGIVPDKPENDIYSTWLDFDEDLLSTERSQFNRLTAWGNIMLKDSSTIFGVQFWKKNSTILIGTDSLLIDTISVADCGPAVNFYIAKSAPSGEVLEFVNLAGPRVNMYAMGHSESDNTFLTVTSYCRDLGKQGADSIFMKEFHPFAEGATIITKWNDELEVVWSRWVLGYISPFDSLDPDTYPYGGIASCDVHVSDDGMISIVGEHYGVMSFEGTLVSNPSGSLHEHFSMKLDSEGNLLKFFKIPDREGGGYLCSTTTTDGHVATGAFREQFVFDGSTYPKDEYIFFFDDTLGLAKIERRGGVLAMDKGENGDLFWTGYLSQKSTFGNFEITPTGSQENLVLAKMTGEGDYLWVTSLSGVSIGEDIAVKGNKVYVFVKYWGSILDANGDTVLKAPDLTKEYSAVVMFEDQHVSAVKESGEYSNGTFWPNPSKGHINIGERSSYAVLNIHGQQVLSGQGSSIDLFNQPDGVYFVVLESGESQMIVLQR